MHIYIEKESEEVRQYQKERKIKTIEMKYGKLVAFRQRDRKMLLILKSSNLSSRSVVVITY